MAPSATCPRPAVRGVVEALAMEEGVGRSLPSGYGRSVRKIWSAPLCVVGRGEVCVLIPAARPDRANRA